MKVLTTITLQSSHKRLRAGSIRSPAALPRMRSAAEHSFRNRPTITDRAITRAGKAQRARHHALVAGTAHSRLCPPYAAFITRMSGSDMRRNPEKTRSALRAALAQHLAHDVGDHGRQIGRKAGDHPADTGHFLSHTRDFLPHGGELPPHLRRKPIHLALDPIEAAFD